MGAGRSACNATVQCRIEVFATFVLIYDYKFTIAVGLGIICLSCIRYAFCTLLLQSFSYMSGIVIGTCRHSHPFGRILCAFAQTLL